MTRMPTLLETGGEPGPQAGQAGPEATGSRKRTGPAARWLERAAQGNHARRAADGRLRPAARADRPVAQARPRPAGTGGEHGTLADQMATAAAQVLHEMCEQAGEGGPQAPAEE